MTSQPNNNAKRAGNSKAPFPPLQGEPSQKIRNIILKAILYPAEITDGAVKVEAEIEDADIDRLVVAVEAELRKAEIKGRIAELREGEITHIPLGYVERRILKLLEKDRLGGNTNNE